METGDPGYGILPACAPLANPYVPYQQDNPATYPAKNGVVRGTLFPGLDLPFMGMTNDVPLDDTPLHELQALCFALTELGLYLDTHKDDREAFELFQSYARLYNEGKAVYEQQYGPLTMEAAAHGETYGWMSDPWPWEYEANQREA
ncbi:MAG: spore coat protein CotJB [Oscillospiraceae bacterium]|nr:spore coat protein CotJB [Oscillospiraceae bacterium]